MVQNKRKVMGQCSWLANSINDLW